MKGRNPFQSLKLSIAATCEYALESRGRWTLVGTFRKLEFDRFPATLDRMEVYLLFTDATDPHLETAGIRLWKAVTPEYFENEEALLGVSTPLLRPAFPQAFEAVFRLKDVVFSEPGCYDLHVEIDSEVFDLIPIYVGRSK